MAKFFGQPELHNWKMRISYGTSGNANGRQEYVGFAPAHAAETDAKWQIYKLTYNSDGLMTERNYANNSDAFDKQWDLRSTEYVYS